MKKREYINRLKDGDEVWTSIKVAEGISVTAYLSFDQAYQLADILEDDQEMNARIDVAKIERDNGAVNDIIVIGG